MEKPKVFSFTFASLYPLYLRKIEKKNRTKDELDAVIFWLTGYNKETLQNQIQQQVTLETFFNEVPLFNPAANTISGVICGVRVEEIEDPLMQKIRYLDKLVDDLAKGKSRSIIL